MKASEIFAAVTLLVEVRQPVFVWGAPGVGKSQVMAQVAEARKVPLQDVRALLLDPVDLRGLPYLQAAEHDPSSVNGNGYKQAKWASPDFLPRDGEGILFLDELNAAAPMVQASCYQLVLLPSLYREGTGRLVIGVDTSGSISERELDQFAAEISAISDQAQPESIHVVYCDEAVTGVQEFGPSEPIELEPRGGEGTDFRPVFQWVEENGVEPACLIYLTDLDCTRYPAVPPNYPVLWVTSSRRAAPFGETVKIIAEV
jgi:hypothetical protein